MRITRIMVLITFLGWSDSQVNDIWRLWRDGEVCGQRNNHYGNRLVNFNALIVLLLLLLSLNSGASPPSSLSRIAEDSDYRNRSITCA